MTDTAPKPEMPVTGVSEKTGHPVRTKKRKAKTGHPLRRDRGLIVGWREWIGLPDLGIEAIRAKIDTGARSSALHAKKIQLFERDGQSWVRFEIVTDHAHEHGRMACTAPVADIRSIKNSFGVSEERVIISTRLRIGKGLWPIEVSLADRENMTFPALLGRTALRKRAIVDPGRSYLSKWVSEQDLPRLQREKTKVQSKEIR